MKKILKYLILTLALFLSNAVFAEPNETSDSTNVETEQRKGIAQREGGSANRGIVYFFYESPHNVGLPHLRFIDTTKSLFHRYEPTMRDNIFNIMTEIEIILRKELKKMRPK